MRYNFDQPVNRSGTSSVKYDGLKEFFNNPDLLPMWVADMDFMVPDCITSEIIDRARHGIFGYTLVRQEFYESIVNWMKVRHGWEILPEWIVFCPGIVPALSISVLALTEPGDKVLLQSPVYPPFFSSIKDNNRIVVNNPLTEIEGRYTIDFGDLEEKLSMGVRMMLFCSPHNPVGRVWTAEEVSEVVMLCKKYDVTLISDEIHSDLIFAGSVHTPAATATNETGNMIICMAPSKTFNLAGLASAFLIIPEKGLRRKMSQMLENLHVHYGNIFGLTALQAAYNCGGEWLNELMAYLKGNRDELVGFFRNSLPVIKPVEPEGTYLVWLDCRGMGMSDIRLKRFFTEGAGIAMNPGPVFGPGGEGFHRINIGCTRKTLMESFNRIEEAWKRI
jgi:cysteine-S-conjugate beta-lyase